MNWIIIFVAVLQVSAGFVGGVKWDRLQVTFGKFTAYPLTSGQARKAGWEMDAYCSDRPNFFIGNRFIYGADEATRLIFDCDGSLAGIQATINSTDTYPTVYNKPPWIQTDNGQMALTIYFRDPKKICVCKGKCQKHKSMKPPIGDRLWIQFDDLRQNHCLKKDSCMMKIPLLESHLVNTAWVEGTCIRAMGVHYHYNISRGLDCDKSLPVFLLFKDAGLVGFGWGGPIDVNSAAWEKPRPSLFARSMQPDTTPECLKDYTLVSVQHVYFVDPFTLLCA